MIQISNHGPLVVATDYWESDAERAGKIVASCNAGAVRLLMPRSLRPAINQMRVGSRYCILSRGPWPEMRLEDAVEIVWEDGSDDPFALHLSPESFADFLPGEPNAGQEWIVSVWDVKKGKPHKALERPCKWRRVAKLPDLSPWRDA